MRTIPLIMAAALVAPIAWRSEALADGHAHRGASQVFLDFLARIDNGEGPAPGPLPEPPEPERGVQDVTIQAWQSLGITHELQRKDTKMLCLDTCNENAPVSWDDGQTDHNGHGSDYCVRASVQMINAYYGGNVSQDRLTYWMIVEYPNSNKKALKTDFDLWHSSGSGTN